MRRIQRQIGASLAITVWGLLTVVVVAAPAAAAPSLKFPWDRAENPWILTQGPHDYGNLNSNSGLDFDKDPGNNKVLSMFAGKVTFAGLSAAFSCGSLGTVRNPVVRVEATDGSGWAIEYLHFSSIAVSKDQTVAQGQVLGYSGNEGCSFGEHLHIELYIGGSHASWFGKTIDGWAVPNCEGTACARSSLNSTNSPGAGGTPTQPSHTYPTNADSVRVRSAPNTGSSIVTTLGPAGTMVHVVCQTTGETINGSNIWDKIDSPAGGYVADTFVNTGTTGFVGSLPRCGPEDKAPPSGRLTSPTPGSVFRPGQSIRVAGDFADDVSVTKVDFFVTDDSYQWKAIGTDGHGGNGTYGVDWVNSYPDGARLHFHAHAFDASGKEAIETVVGVDGVSVDGAPPTGSFTTPKPGSYVDVLQEVQVGGEFSDPNGVSKVEFFVADESLQWKPIGTDSHGGNGAYAVTWAVDYVPGKTLHFSARPSDALGNQSGEAGIRLDGVFVALRTAHQRTLSVSMSKHLVITGRIRGDDGYRPCLSRHQVNVQRRSGGSWRTIKNVLSDETGQVSARVPDKTGTYRLRVPQTRFEEGPRIDTCLRTTSPPTAHRH